MNSFPFFKMNALIKISIPLKPPTIWGVLFPLVFIAFSPASFTQETYKDEAMETINLWERMWNSYDLSEVEQLFVTDESITYFSSEKIGIIQGIQNVREHHIGFGFVKGGKISEAKLWLENMRIESIGQVTLVTGIWYFQRTPEADKQHGPVTFILVNHHGNMKIKHVHFANY